MTAAAICLCRSGYCASPPGRESNSFCKFKLLAADMAFESAVFFEELFFNDNDAKLSLFHQDFFLLFLWIQQDAGGFQRKQSL